MNVKNVANGCKIDIAKKEVGFICEGIIYVRTYIHKYNIQKYHFRNKKCEVWKSSDIYHRVSWVNTAKLYMTKKKINYIFL